MACIWQFPLENTNKNTATVTTNSNNNNNDDDEYFNHLQPKKIKNDNNVSTSKYSPMLVVIDFDHTLAVYDRQNDITLYENDGESIPSLYLRPFVYDFLDYMKSINKHNVLILWTTGTHSYIRFVLLLGNIAQYFDRILSREHCTESKSHYGISKSHAYLINKFPEYNGMRSIIIDDRALINGVNSGYDEMICLKPFTVQVVKRCLKNFDNDKISRKEIYGDTTLLNTIFYLQNKYFDYYNNSKNYDNLSSLSIIPYVITINEKNNELIIIKNDCVNTAVNRFIMFSITL